MAANDEAEIDSLLQTPGTVRSRRKVEASVANARAFSTVEKEFRSFDRHIWRFDDGRPIQNAWESLADIPAQTPLSRAMSKDLKKRGFKFVEPTTCCSFTQAIGMVNYHTVDCCRNRELA